MNYRNVLPEHCIHVALRWLSQFFNRWSWWGRKKKIIKCRKF